MDVDGTMTDGAVFLDGEGGEFKRFDVRDGLGGETGYHQRAMLDRNGPTGEGTRHRYRGPGREG